MRRILVFAMLALSISTTAAAQPWPWPYDRGNTPERYDQRDTRYDGRYERDRYSARDRYRWTRDYRGRWVTLASGYSARTDRQFVNLRGAGPYRHLRIEADRGRPVILKVAIQDMRGNTQVVNMRERLTAGEGQVITLNQGAPINRIVVYTDPRAGGAYSVYGG
ncbi:MAG: hypothetical protein KIT31_04255 [Deltaproteobacteria bacterium]|nr:hypothetical protein [Deltaproteobacteria bacterium]